MIAPASNWIVSPSSGLWHCESSPPSKAGFMLCGYRVYAVESGRTPTAEKVGRCCSACAREILKTQNGAPPVSR